MDIEAVDDRLRGIPAELVALTVVAALLRLYRLGDESLWNDEFASMEDALLLGETLRSTARPLYYVLLRPWIEIAGTSEVAMRLPAVALGVATVPAVYYLADRLYGRRAAGFAGLLVAFSRLHLRWSQEVRMYALFALLAVLSYLALVRYLEDPGRRRLAAYLAATVAMGYTHHYAVFVVLGQNLYVAATWILSGWRDPGGDPRRWIPVQAALAVALLPVAVRSLGLFAGADGGPGVVGWIPEPTPLVPVTATAHLLYKTLDPALTLLAFVAVVGTAGLAVARYRSERRWGALLACWFGAVVLVPFAVSMTVKPILQTRYTMVAVPAAAVLVGAGLADLHDRIDERFIERMAVAALVLVLAVPLVGYYGEPQHEQWRETAAFLDERAEGGDAVIVSRPYMERNLVHYLERRDLDTAGVPADASRERLATAAGDADRVWVVLSNVNESQRDALLGHLASFGEPDGRFGARRGAGVAEAARVKSFELVHVYAFRNVSTDGIDMDGRRSSRSDGA